MAESETGESQSHLTDSDIVEVVEFVIDGAHYVIDVAQMQRSRRMKPLDRVPRSAESIAGITDIRGEITTVIDMRPLFDMATEEEVRKEAQDPHPKDRILVLDDSLDDQKVGLRVDNVIGVRDFPEDHLVSDAELSSLDLNGYEDDLIKSAIRLDPESEDEDSEEEESNDEMARFQFRDRRGIDYRVSDTIRSLDDVEGDEPRLRAWLNIEQILEESQVDPHDRAGTAQTESE